MNKMTETTTIKMLEQGRVKFAYDCAKKGNKIQASKEYKAYSKKMLALIKTNGLGATLAFIMTKSEDDENKKGYAYKLLYNQTKEWLKRDTKKLIELNENEDLVEKIISLDSSLYRAVTNEVITLFKWISRFADGLK